MTVLNAFTVDLEDWISPGRRAFESVGSIEAVRTATKILLDKLSEHNACATFFVVGSIAAQAPTLIRQVFDHGHEIGIHGWEHERVDVMSPNAFRSGVRRAKAIVEQCIGREVIGFRAPYFSISAKSLWPLAILHDEGFRYDSSILNVPSRSGSILASSPLYQELSGLTEVRPTQVRFLGMRCPFGGGYLSLYPETVIDSLIQESHGNSSPLVLYCHPYNFGFTKLIPSRIDRFRERIRQQTAEQFLSRRFRNVITHLLDRGAWSSIERVLGYA